MGKILIENMSKNVSSIYTQKLINHAKQSATDALKSASKRAIQKTAEAAGDLIGNTITDKITKVPRTSPQNSLGIVTNETENIEVDREIPK